MLQIGCEVSALSKWGLALLPPGAGRCSVLVSLGLFVECLLWAWRCAGHGGCGHKCPQGLTLRELQSGEASMLMARTQPRDGVL